MIQSSVKKALKANKLIYPAIYFAKYIVCRPFNRLIRHMIINTRVKMNLYTKNGKRLQRFKNSKAGKTCVIIGNGPSIRMEDLSRISTSGIDSFGANRILDLAERTEWRPTYMCVCDSTFLTGVNTTTTCGEYLEAIDRYGVKALFVADYMKRHMRAEEENLYYIDFFESGEFSSKVKHFSDDAAMYISELGTVTNFSIQLAVYMGYKKIYLYGMDNNYTKYFGDDGEFHVDSSIHSHVEGIKTGIVDIPTDIIPKSKFQATYIGGFSDIRKANIGYKMSRNYCDNSGIIIVNITRGGHLEVFERRQFEKEIG